VIERVIDARLGVVQLIGSVVLVAVGVNLVSPPLAAALGGWAPLVGTVLILGTLVGLALLAFRGLRETVLADGIVLTHNGEVVSIPRYDLAEDLARVVEAITKENEALSRQWRDDPLVFPKDESNPAKDRNNPQGTGAKLLREALEYVYLELLSQHLSNYFSNSALSHLAEEHQRADLLPLLEENRVLDLLSSPLEDRIALLEAQQGRSHFIQMTRRTIHEDGREDEVLVWASDGHVMYQRLDLALPKGVKVKRIAKGHVRLDSRILRTDLTVEFDGFGSSVDPEFLNEYLGLSASDFYGHGDDSGSMWMVRFTFTSSVKWLGLLTPRGWRLHRWAASFGTSLKTSFERDALSPDRNARDQQRSLLPQQPARTQSLARRALAAQRQRGGRGRPRADSAHRNRYWTTTYGDR
jgi:hypothetical protein